ncbi:MAG: TRAP transporter large permease [Hyphomicrobiaceae bacterium]
MTERELIGVSALAVLFALIAAGVPIALAMLLVAVGGAYVLSLFVPFLRFEPYLLQFKTALFSTVTSYDLSIVPLFLLMGFLAARCGLSRDLFEGIEALVGRFRGGTAIATIAACAGFGAVCGSSLATASTMGRIALPEFARAGTHKRFAAGVLAAGGTLGILIPPSVALVLYAVIVEASVIDMFRAALVPGAMAVLGFIGVVLVLVWRDRELAPAAPESDRRQRRLALLRLVPVLAIFGAMIMGVGVGLFTPTPAAAVGVALVIAYGWLRPLIFGTGAGTDRLDGAALRAALRETAQTGGMIYLILFAADVLKGFFARTGLPSALSDWLLATGLGPFQILALLLIGLIVLGCFFESLALILVVVPFVWPALVQLNGGDVVTADQAGFGMTTDDLKIWFGILALVVIELGLITPPVGLNVFVIKSLSDDLSVADVFRGVMPFFAVELLRVAVLFAVPAFVLAIPWALR